MIAFTMKYKPFFKTIFSILVLFLTLTSTLFAQQNSDADKQAKKLERNLKNDYFSFGLMVQGMVDYQPKRVSGNNGFTVSKGRFKISGIFNDTFGYKLQATILKSPSLIDANVYYKPTSHLTVKLGRFKSPFSYEYDTGAGSIPFVKRSTVVNQLDPKRQLGVQFQVYTPNRFLRLMGGFFNGDNNGGLKNADNDLQYIGRLEANLSKSGNKKSAKLGINFSYEEKDWLSQAGGIQAKRTLFGSYLIFAQNEFSFNGEFIYSWLNPVMGQNQNPYGYYANIGYSASKQSQFLLRWDSFTGDNLFTDTNSLIAGYNYSPTEFAKLKLNYVLPTEQAVGYSNFLVAFQISY